RRREMIGFDFEYRKPSSFKEAITLWKAFREANKHVMYFAGGTELISRARRNEIKPDAIIDIKGIKKCQGIENGENNIIIGATATLTEVAESNVFPLLTKVIRQIATKTERNKITIGGNLLSHLPYKEAILPFLLADSYVVIATASGLKEKSIAHIMTDQMQLDEGEFVVQIVTDANMATTSFYTEKITKQSKVNYPIVTAASMQVDGEMRFACSGLCEHPFRDTAIDTELNDCTLSAEERVGKIIQLVPGNIVDDKHASKNYRTFVFTRTVTTLIEQMEEPSS